MNKSTFWETSCFAVLPLIDLDNWSLIKSLKSGVKCIQLVINDGSYHQKAFDIVNSVFICSLWIVINLSYINFIFLWRFLLPHLNQRIDKTSLFFLNIIRNMNLYLKYLQLTFNHKKPGLSQSCFHNQRDQETNGNLFLRKRLNILENATVPLKYSNMLHGLRESCRIILVKWNSRWKNAVKML